MEFSLVLTDILITFIVKNNIERYTCHNYKLDSQVQPVPHKETEDDQHCSFLVTKLSKVATVLTS